ncbi:Chitinase 1, partial [Apophysomyces ossiformis]
WGQNSYGAANGNDPANWQKPLAFYCDDDTVDVFPVSFVTKFFSTGGLPEINLANYCNTHDNASFPNSNLANCSALGDDIKYCQKRGKAVTISLGGATGGVGFSTQDQAVQFADIIWNLFLGGSSKTRPFGDAVLDGVDLDIEGGGANYYSDFLTALKAKFKTSDKKYYITAAPQCVYPDANLGATINAVGFDAIYVQFYNNPCGLQTYTPGKGSNWNFGIWDYWARHISPNKDVKVYIGAPASSSAAGGGYIPLDRLKQVAVDMRNSFPSFGGVMFWDASQAYANNRIDVGIKQALKQGGSCNQAFKFPPCDAPAWSSGGNGYPAGSRVSYKYIWEAKWYASEAPQGNVDGTWSVISACAGSGSGNGTSVATTTTTTTTTTTERSTVTTTTTAKATTTTTTTTTVTAGPTSTSDAGSSSGQATPTKTLSPSSSSSSTTTTTAVPTGNADSCKGVAPWSDSAVYVKGDKVVYDSKLWVAAWWTKGDKPGGLAGVWSSIGSCASTSSGSSANSGSSGSDPKSDTPPHFRNKPGTVFPVVDSPTCDQARPWQPNTAYTAGSKVLYKEQVYIASWRNANEEPTVSNALVWEKDPSCTVQHRRKRGLLSIRTQRACQRSWSEKDIYDKYALIHHGPGAEWGLVLPEYE